MKMNSNNFIRPWRTNRRIPQFYILHFVLHSWFIRHRRTLSESGNPPKCEKNLFMQNEPNFQCSRSKLNAVIADSYNKISLVNQKITNPIEPNTNPIPKRPKINPNSCNNRELQRKTSFAPKNNEPNRTQSQPNTNPKRTQSGFIPCIGLHFCSWTAILSTGGALCRPEDMPDDCKCLLERYLVTKS